MRPGELAHRRIRELAAEDALIEDARPEDCGPPDPDPHKPPTRIRGFRLPGARGYKPGAWTWTDDERLRTQTLTDAGYEVVVYEAIRHYPSRAD